MAGGEGEEERYVYECLPQTPFSAFLYRYRNRAERFFSKLKHFRAVVTRFESPAKTTLLSSNSLQPESGCDL